MKIIKHLKNNTGDGYIYAVVLILVVFMFVNFLFQFFVLTMNAKNIKNAVENAIVSVSLDNYAKMYSSEREGYTGAYKKDGGSWNINISNGDVYAKLTKSLNLTKQGSNYIRFSGDSKAFTLSNFNVEATAAIFKSTGSTTNMFQARATIELEMPLSFMGIQLSPIHTSVNCISKYNYKF